MRRPSRDGPLQIEMLAKLGVEKLILTAAGRRPEQGSCRHPPIRSATSACSTASSRFSPRDIPLFAGEFCSPRTPSIPPSPNRPQVAGEIEPLLRPTMAATSMIRGPFFEGRKYDKPGSAATGARVVA